MKKIIALFAISALPVFVCAQVSVTITTSQVNCYNGCDGSATAVPTGGTPPYTYSWAPTPATTATATNLCAGFYTVTVTDQLGGTGTQTCLITQPSALNVTITMLPAGPVCVGSSIQFNAMASGGTGPYSYLWNFPGGSPASSTVANPSVTYNTAGVFTASCTITDASGCMVSSTAMITVSAASVGGTVGGSTSHCSTTNSGSFTLSGHTGSVIRWEFSIDGGVTWANIANTSTTQSYTNVAQDRLYRARVQSGVCAAAYSTNGSVNIFPAPVVTVTPNAASICAGGTVTLTASGAMTYTWVPSLLSGNPVVLSPAATTTYTVIGSDANGCTASDTATITVNAAPTVTTAEVPATCNGAGTVIATPAGGTPPYTYLWSPGSYTTPSVMIIGANQTYTVDITDANGCTVQGTQLLTDSCDYVWPGDANDDAVADNIDILDIGIANGATGTPRANASLTWIGQPSTAWGTTLLSGTDYKWVDCNGDGTIDLNDTDAVVQNYGLTHNNRVIQPQYSSVNPDLSISFDQDSVGGGNSGTLTLALGTQSNPATNVYGLAFRLNYDAAQISTSSIGLSGASSWFGTPGNDLMRVVLHPNAAMGYVDVAITRLDQQDVSGSGPIATVYFTAMTTLNGTGNTAQVPMTITNIVLIDHNETMQAANAINDTVLVMDDALITNVAEPTAPALAVYPNPANENITVIIPGTEQQLVTIEDVTGRVVYAQQHNGGVNTIPVATLPAGAYVLRVTASNGTVTTEQIAIAR